MSLWWILRSLKAQRRGCKRWGLHPLLLNRLQRQCSLITLACMLSFTMISRWSLEAPCSITVIKSHLLSILTRTSSRRHYHSNLPLVRSYLVCLWHQFLSLFKPRKVFLKTLSSIELKRTAFCKLSMRTKRNLWIGQGACWETTWIQTLRE